VIRSRRRDARYGERCSERGDACPVGDRRVRPKRAPERRRAAALFVDLLWSLVWTDRNKSSVALSRLTVGRDSALVAELRARAIRPLIDILRWTDPGHGLPALVILGWIEGRTDEEIFGLIRRGDRAAIVALAEAMLK
jgi:hypothetical protein